MKLRSTIVIPAALAIALAGCGRDRMDRGAADREVDRGDIRQEDVQRGTGAQDGWPGYGQTQQPMTGDHAHPGTGPYAPGGTLDHTRPGGQAGVYGDPGMGTADGQGMADRQTPMTGTADRVTNDQDWVRKAIESNMAEVELGRLAQQRATSPEVKRFADHLVHDHQRASENLREIARNKNLNVPSDMGQEHRQVMQRLQGLSGQEFDRAFMSEMVRSHEKSVNHFQQGSTNLNDENLRSFASKTQETLKLHLDHAQQISREAGQGQARPRS